MCFTVMIEVLPELVNMNYNLLFCDFKNRCIVYTV